MPNFEPPTEDAPPQDSAGKVVGDLLLPPSSTAPGNHPKWYEAVNGLLTALVTSGLFYLVVTIADDKLPHVGRLGVVWFIVHNGLIFYRQWRHGADPADTSHDPLPWHSR